MESPKVTSPDLAKQYWGATATHYEQDRVGQAKWAREQTLVPAMLEELPRGATLLDVPVGTGRFFDAYHALGLRPTGIDISQAMLSEAQAKAAQIGLPVALEEGDIRRLRFSDDTFDCALCIRLFNLIELPDVVQGIRELARVSRRHVILGVRYFVPTGELLQRPGGARLVLGQIARKLRATTSRRATKIHPRARILEAFARSGLTIARSACVEQSANGSELMVFLLEKSRTSA